MYNWAHNIWRITWPKQNATCLKFLGLRLYSYCVPISYSEQMPLPFYSLHNTSLVSLCSVYKGIHPYHSLSYTSGDTATDSPVHVGRSGMAVKESPRKESLLSYLTGSFPSLHNLLEGTPQRSTTAVKSSSLTRTGMM